MEQFIRKGLYYQLSKRKNKFLGFFNISTPAASERIFFFNPDIVFKRLDFFIVFLKVTNNSPLP